LRFESDSKSETYDIRCQSGATGGVRRYLAKSMMSAPLARFIARGREDAPVAPRRASLCDSASN